MLMPIHLPRGRRPTIYTIGHSNLSIEDFFARLAAHGIEQIVDVRRHPRSHRHPQFSRAEIARSLSRSGRAYRHFEGLGGHRDPPPRSPHTALPEGALRGYADHMSTGRFRTDLAALVQAASVRPTAVMCAEANPRRCHRQLLSDALVVRGIEVLHVIDEDTVVPHALPSAARLAGDRIVYDAGLQDLWPGDAPAP